MNGPYLLRVNAQFVNHPSVCSRDFDQLRWELVVGRHFVVQLENAEFDATFQVHLFHEIQPEKLTESSSVDHEATCGCGQS